MRCETTGTCPLLVSSRVPRQQPSSPCRKCGCRTSIAPATGYFARTSSGLTSTSISRPKNDHLHHSPPRNTCWHSNTERGHFFRVFKSFPMLSLDIYPALASDGFAALVPVDRSGRIVFPPPGRARTAGEIGNPTGLGVNARETIRCWIDPMARRVAGQTNAYPTRVKGIDASGIGDDGHCLLYRDRPVLESRWHEVAPNR